MLKDLNVDVTVQFFLFRYCRFVAFQGINNVDIDISDPISLHFRKNLTETAAKSFRLTLSLIKKILKSGKEYRKTYPRNRK